MAPAFRSLGTEHEGFAELSVTSRHFVCNTRPMAFGLMVLAKKFVKTVQSKFSQGQRSPWDRKCIADRVKQMQQVVIILHVQLRGMQNFRNMARPARSG
jgi:hypothetical protein